MINEYDPYKTTPKTRQPPSTRAETHRVLPSQPSHQTESDELQYPRQHPDSEHSHVLHPKQGNNAGHWSGEPGLDRAVRFESIGKLHSRFLPEAHAWLPPADLHPLPQSRR